MIRALYEWLFERERLGGKARASDWSTWRKQHIKDYCELCLKKGSILSPLELHHVKKFSDFPELEKDPDNVVTGCRTCHLKFYHLGSFLSANKYIKEDIKTWQLKIKNRP